jgi:exosome complex protein LRP1
MDFGELKNDNDFIQKIRNFDGCLVDIEDSVQKITNFKGYDDLSIEDKVKYDIFLTYTVNSLYFLYLKLQGNSKNVSNIHAYCHPNKPGLAKDWFYNEIVALFVSNYFPQDDIKHELTRVKIAMKRNSDIHDCKTIRPKLDKDAAKRFVKSGLWDKDQKKDKSANKHKRFTD